MLNENFANSGEIGMTVEGTWYYPQYPGNPEHKKTAQFACLSTVSIHDIIWI